MQREASQTIDSEDVAPTTDQQLLSWAKQFIREVADGRHDTLYSLDEFTFEQHTALAQAAPQAMRHRSSKIRRAAAWVVSMLEVVSDEVVPLLRRLLRDRIALVRMAAAWACGEMGTEAGAAVSDLMECLRDKNSGVRFAAVCALDSLGLEASAAVEPLLEVVKTTTKEQHRFMAIKALADIDPRHPAVQELIERELESPVGDQQFVAAYGVAQAESGSDAVVSRLVKNLQTANPYIAVISAWAIGKLKNRDQDTVPSLLAALKRMEWLQIEHSEEPGQEFISIRPDFRDALQQTLPRTDDLEYEDFRLKFFLHVFRPTPPENNSWVDEIVNHPWYLKIQRRRFGHPANAFQRNAIRELVQDAQAKFAQRLLKNPTLGVRPEDHRLLPGFIRNHCRNIAWRLRRKHQAEWAGRVSGNIENVADWRRATSDDTTLVVAELKEFIESQLPDEERDVARFRWILRFSIAETAAALSLTKSMVKTREKNARNKARQHFVRHGD